MTPPLLLILCTFLTTSFAAPASTPLSNLAHSLVRRSNDAIIKGTFPNITALDPITFAPIPQTPPTDGGGTGGFTSPHIAWLGFGAVVGLPLLTAGVRGYRVTTGVGMGLLFAAALWAAFVNTIDTSSLVDNPLTSDLIFTVIVLGVFMIGFIVGFLPWGIRAGMAMLGVTGGAALGMLIVMLRPNLLVPIFGVNWAIIGLLMFSGPIFIICRQKLGMIVACTANGSFLSMLSLDLAITQQAGMSRGLRFLTDRSNRHVIEFLTKGYVPPLKTQIILGIAIALIPIASFAQWKWFPGPFIRTEEELAQWEAERSSKVDDIGEKHLNDDRLLMVSAPGSKKFSFKPVSRFSHM